MTRIEALVHRDHSGYKEWMHHIQERIEMKQANKCFTRGGKKCARLLSDGTPYTKSAQGKSDYCALHGGAKQFTRVEDGK